MAKRRDMRFQYDDDDEDVIEEPSWAIPLIVLGAVVILSLAFLGYYFRPTLGQLLGKAPAPSMVSQPIDVIVAGQRYRIPASFTRFAYARHGGVQSKVELYALLPDMLPYAPERAEAFQDYGPESKVVFIDIDSKPADFTEQDRFNRVYMRLVTDPDGRRGPAGLRRYEFDTTSSFKNEELFVHKADDGSVVVLRCMKKAPDIASPNCRRDTELGKGQSLHYRFKRAYLDDWQKINDGVLALITSFERTKGPDLPRGDPANTNP